MVGIKKNGIIVDLDNTLTDCTHRLHHIQREHPNWNAFYHDMATDRLNIWCSVLIEAVFHKNVDVLLVTGRPEGFRTATRDWLERFQIPFSGLFMRSAKDRRDDTEVKAGIYERKIEPEYNVLFAVEDRKRVADMWRAKGLVCLQCAEGNY